MKVKKHILLGGEDYYIVTQKNNRFTGEGFIIRVNADLRPSQLLREADIRQVWLTHGLQILKAISAYEQGHCPKCQGTLDEYGKCRICILEECIAYNLLTHNASDRDTQAMIVKLKKLKSRGQ